MRAVYAESGVGTPRGLCHWGLRWSSLWGQKRVKNVPNLVYVCHVGCATGAFSGAPYGATKRVRCVCAWKIGRGYAMRT
eukprot:6734074-Pyramimonas_sp.AAC.1